MRVAYMSLLSLCNVASHSSVDKRSCQPQVSLHASPPLFTAIRAPPLRRDPHANGVEFAKVELALIAVPSGCLSSDPYMQDSQT